MVLGEIAETRMEAADGGKRTIDALATLVGGSPCIDRFAHNGRDRPIRRRGLTPQRLRLRGGELDLHAVHVHDDSTCIVHGGIALACDVERAQCNDVRPRTIHGEQNQC